MLSIRRSTWPRWVWQKLVIKHHKVFQSPVPDSHCLIISSAAWHVWFSKIRAFHLLSSQSCLRSDSTSQPRLTLALFTAVSNPHPILIMGQGAWKDLSVCLFPFLFGFHGLASWLHRKQEKQNRKKDKMCFTSVSFQGKSQLLQATCFIQDSQRCWDFTQTSRHTLRCSYIAAHMNATCLHLLCNSLHTVINRGGQGHK